MVWYSPGEFGGNHRDRNKNLLYRVIKKLITVNWNKCVPPPKYEELPSYEEIYQDDTSGIERKQKGFFSKLFGSKSPVDNENKRVKSESEKLKKMAKLKIDSISLSLTEMFYRMSLNDDLINKITITSNFEKPITIMSNPVTELSIDMFKDFVENY